VNTSSPLRGEKPPDAAHTAPCRLYAELRGERGSWGKRWVSGGGECWCLGCWGESGAGGPRMLGPNTESRGIMGCVGDWGARWRGEDGAPECEVERGRTRVGVAPGSVMNWSLPVGASVSSARERLTELAKGGAWTLCAPSVPGARRTGPPGAGAAMRPSASRPDGDRRRTTSQRTSPSAAGRHCTLTT
jgi:hypothetical protein